MNWLNRVLVGVDFSSESVGAVHYGAFLANFFVARLELLHVLPSNELLWARQQDALRVIDRAMRLRKILDTSPHRSIALNASIVIEVGDAIEAFQAAIEARNPEIVLVGKSLHHGSVLSALRDLVPDRLIEVPRNVRIPMIRPRDSAPVVTAA